MEHSGRYRIQAVSEMTGLAAATLRTWERRYGVPSPQRSGSSYRLYSDADVQQITRLQELTRRGLSVAEAARQVVQDGAPEPVVGDLATDPMAVVERRIMGALARYDLDAVETEVRRAVLLGPAALVFQRVFLPLLREVGARWEAGELTVTQEHLISEMLTGFSREVLRAAQPVGASRRVLLACFADEQHILPLYAVAFQFAQWGYRTIMLGARTPPDAVRFAVEGFEPDVVGLSVTTLPADLQGIDELLASYAQACGDRPWVVGGAAASRIADRIEAHGGLVAPSSPAALHTELQRLLG